MPLVVFSSKKVDILLDSETKIDNKFPLTQFCVECYSIPYRFDRTSKGGGLLFYVRDDKPSKQLSKEEEAFEGFFVEINLRKKVVSLLLL